MDRRSFLQMLGLGGMALVAAGTPLPLFGGEEDKSPIWMPSKELISGHWVVKRKRFLDRVSPEDQAKGIVGRITKNREPSGIVHRETVTLTQVLTQQPKDVKDSHVLFYGAARDIRKRFAEHSLQFLERSKMFHRGVIPLTLVTIADTEIHIRPRYIREDEQGYIVGQRVSSTSEVTGFDVVAHFEQFAVQGTSLSELKTFDSYSQTGDYPISIPKDIDFGLLLEIDHRNRHGSILSA